MRLLHWEIMGVLLLCTACVSVKFSENPADYQGEIATLSERLRQNPQDASAARDLGITYFQTRRYDDANYYLTLAHQLDNQDPKTRFYVGLSAEFDGREREALSAYRNYRNVSRLSPYRKMMLGRYLWLTRKLAREEISALVDIPITINTARIIPGTVAVFPLIYRGADDRFSPLGRGLSEMIIIDLGKVDEIRLVERIRVQVLLDELAFAEGKYTDPTTSPRNGQLLGADKIVGGIYNIEQDAELFVDVAFWDTAENDIPSINAERGLLDNLFDIEKNIVFKILGDLGIRLSPEQEQELLEVPTKNFRAFLAYCKGLEKEDSGQFSEAMLFYQQSTELDPGFIRAKQRGEEAAALRIGAGSKEQALRTAWSGKFDADDAADPVASRLQRMGSSIGTLFVPGEDSRRPIEEAADAGFGELPPPPPPPPGSGGG